MFKKLLSYIIPINIYQQKSTISNNLEVTWNNGQLVLDSANTNYSFGSLQRILKKGLSAIGYAKIVAMQDILLLGVGAGSVIKTLVDDLHFKGKITGVEIDPEIINIANKYFKLNTIPTLQIVIADANEFVLHNNNNFDLIIIDVFQDNNLPGFLFEQKFIDSLSQMLNVNGFILFNTMVTNKEEDCRNKKYLLSFDANQFTAEKILKLEQRNELIIIHKNSSPEY